MFRRAGLSVKRPAFQFYPGDWQRDAGLRLCSVGARGLWIEMMCVMHQAEPYGCLVLNGKPFEPAQLARMVGASDREVKRWMHELNAAGVYSVDDDGRIFSRRMVRDEQQRERRAEVGRENGIKGKDFGALGAEHGAKGGRPRSDNPGSKPGEEPPHIPRPSSSSSSSASPSTAKAESKDTVGPKPDALTLTGDAEQPSTARQQRQQAREVLTFLNEKTGRNYQPVDANLELIVARLKEGATVGDCRAVIAKKCREWKGDSEMDEYLRPKTLFNRTNFAQYQGELGVVDAPASQAPGDTGDIVERIPLNDGSEFEVRRSYVAELDRLFPQVDPVATLSEIRRWMIAAGADAKPSRSNVRPRIASWFTREQEKWSSAGVRAAA